MKKMAILAFAFLSLLISTSWAQDVKVKDDKVKIKDKSDSKMNNMVTGNYKAAYSSDFKMGNPLYAKKIMEMWQDWDDNMLDRHDYFADSLVMYFADGGSMKGKAENIAEGKKFRGGIASVKTDLHAIVPLRSNDRNEDVVCIWGMETNTFADGKVEKKNIHEVWFFNKDGKITALRQWAATVK